ncbi:MAG: O-antigen ligase family protein [Bryobacteraceae bacterium]
MSGGWSQRLEARFAWPLLWVLVFTIPWEKSLMVPGIGTITRLVGLLAALSAAVVILLRRRLRQPNLALVLLALFTVWSGTTYLWSLDPAATAARTATLAQLLVMAGLIWEFGATARRQQWLIAAYVLGTAVSSLLTLSRFVRGLETYYRRYAATGFEPNDLGLTAALSIPLGLLLAWQDRGWRRWMWRAITLLAITAVVVTASRTAFVVACMAFLFVLWTWRETDLPQKLSAVLLLGVLLTGPSYLTPPPARQRLAALPQEITRGTLHNRTQIWKAGWAVFRQRPLHGVGAGAYAQSVRPWLGVPARPGHRYVAHNTYLSVLVECGLVGFTLFLAAAVVLAVFVWWMPPLERSLWSVMLAVCGTGIVTLSWEHRKPVWWIAAMIMSVWAVSFLSQERQS